MRRGIIPARAGFTGAGCRQRRSCWDHPRSRGVYGGAGAAVVVAVGSSPLARGLQAVLGVDVDAGGIIPARAGFTRRRLWMPSDGPDHPRSRGVYTPPRPTDPSEAGSSPLARGLHARVSHQQRRVRIIPARAGFTPRRGPSSRTSRDHPRSRGVYSASTAASSPGRGSSPLARGLLPAPRHQLREGWIIPARAGFTQPGAGLGTASRDHPRSRGVYPLHPLGGGDPPGSSPLARGLPAGPTTSSRGRGIIPARAGFTGT